jgi:hypothetical protein
MSKKTNQLLLIIGIGSFAIPFLIATFFSGTAYHGSDFIDKVLVDGANHLLRTLIFFMLLEPFSLLWKKYISKKKLHPIQSQEFWDDAIESLFVYWLFITLLFLPGYPIWYLFK